MTVWEQLAKEIKHFTGSVRELRVVSDVTPAEIRRELESRYDFRTPLPLEKVMADVGRMLRRWTVHVTHPRYFGLFNPSVHEAGIAGDALAALYNPQLAVWSHAPAAHELERHVLRSLARNLGWDPDTALANFTTGGAEANLSAVLAALAERFPQIGARGLGTFDPRLAIYVTADTHHSFVKIARMTGLGTEALRTVDVTPMFAMNPEALRQRIETDLQSGDWWPLMIVGTAGTTTTGSIDPLPELARAAACHGAWFHVDAAWGGSAALSPKLRPALTGIEQADSVTWDAHKWLSVPMGAGMFFCRRPDALKQAFSSSTSYMPEDSGADTVDPYAVTVQWSRRAIGLKVFMTLAELGEKGYATLIEHQTAMGDLLRERLQLQDWTIVNMTPLPLVCFTHPDIEQGRTSTRRILDTIYERGRVWISDAIAGGQPVLRACITSYRTEPSDIDVLMAELELARKHSW
ncbi:MAG: aminotransferase class V-fold PLP-dependent enzyme [Gammaproteobacteria bacterium]|nr:aminotransferase class V-fold PLP-dependent enzyme [Gammaproteobacteria bacterium]NIR85769.1 aminotransferase class V-fold PLP-dependent enzyme [Gammaproteobacteria bacterium]NIR90302.1 aminotransferase class V-fold PLP-dependent enzyme [Gammaproteobacteria bacterium]NIU06903.1 aminotransferase class V-fold PLP-dependent enzyme [Gammaproteobacteria bacterium]NIV53836.1 aminotransferase class V-fold PLP-dependent enzyme [Gammaproteobacteria bacterium]